MRIGILVLVGYARKILKRPLLELFARSDISAAAMRSYADWLTIILLANRRRTTNSYPISLVEMRRALRRAGTKALPSVAHRLALEMEATEPDEKKHVWHELVGPVFQAIWPLDLELQSNESTFKLVQILKATGDAFTEAADIIVPLLRPDERGKQSTVFSMSEAPEALYVGAPEKVLEFARRFETIPSSPSDRRARRPSGPRLRTLLIQPARPVQTPKGVPGGPCAPGGATPAVDLVEIERDPRGGGGSAALQKASNRLSPSGPRKIASREWLEWRQERRRLLALTDRHPRQQYVRHKRGRLRLEAFSSNRALTREGKMPNVRVFTFGPAWGLPTAGPFGIKLLAWLELAGIPYERISEEDPRKGPKGKSPWIELDGKRIGDSAIIVETLSQVFKTDLDSGLSPEQRGIGLAWRCTFEEHFHQVLEWELFVHPAGEAYMRERTRTQMPAVVGSVVFGLIKSHIRRQLSARGIGRHAQEMIEAMGRADLDALAAYLGERPFLLSDRPTYADTAVFGLLAPMIRWPMDTPVARHAKSLPALMGFCDRMQETCFGRKGQSSSRSAA